MNYNSLNENQKSFIATSASIIIALLLIWFFVYANIAEIKIINKEIDLIKKEIAEKNMENDFKNSLAIYRQYNKKMERMNKSLLTKNRELEFITALENIAAKHGVEQRISMTEYKLIEGRPFWEMPVQIFLKGEFIDELRYLQEAEKLSYYLNVEKMNISKTKTEDSPDEVVNMLIFANTFWR